LRKKSIKLIRPVVLAAIITGGCNAGHPSKEQLDQVNHLVGDRTDVRWDAQHLFDDSIPAAQPIDVLTLSTATEQSLAHNLSLIASGENLSIAHAQMVQAGLFPNPTIGQSGPFAFPISPNGGYTPFDILISDTINGFITQPTKVAVAKFQEVQANIDLSSDAFTLAQQVDSKYQEMISLIRRKRLQIKIQELYKRALAAAEARQKVGIISTPEVNRARLDFDDSRRQVQHLTAQYDRAAREMNWLMGNQSAPQWKLPAEVIDDIASVPIPSFNGSDKLETLAMQFRLDLSRADFDRKVADKSLDLAKFGLIPETSVGFDYTWDTSHHHTAGPQFSVALPIFDPGLVGLELAKAQKRLMDKTYTALAGQVRQDVRTAFDNWKIAADDVAFFRERLIPQQEENVRLMELSFRLGNDDLDTLLNVYQSYVSQLQAYEDAIQAYHDATVSLQQAVGLTWSKIKTSAGATTLPTTQSTTQSTTRPTNGAALRPATLPTTQTTLLEVP
jgi:cobalt-zinc-cadmium efflux system outer membrane protein